ncbi:uncharacterized protein METZ01_LOCUS326539 [marine metagenome]|uniref:Uncharacterized protein n=1 Tax=marine metagenome TaxID=408172 RepID=A0A382PLZ5_9ZZZZ
MSTTFSNKLNRVGELFALLLERAPLAPISVPLSSDGIFMYLY